MTINTPVDQMYADIIMLGLLCMFTGRNWSLMSLVHTNGYIESRRRAFTYMVLNGIALGLTVAALTVIYVHSGISDTISLLNQMITPFMIAGWIAVVVHVLLVPYFSYMMYWLWKKRNMRMADKYLGYLRQQLG